MALTAMGITFVVSLGRNELITSFVRCVYAFIIVFACMFAVRFLLGTVAGLKRMDGAPASVGSSINLVTPPDDVLVPNLPTEEHSEAEQQEFIPLKPQRLISKDKVDPQLMAESLRHMSEE